jgi:hypothetical protein
MQTDPFNGAKRSAYRKIMSSPRKIGPFLAPALLILVISISPSVSATTTTGTLLRGFDVPFHFTHFIDGPTGAFYWPVGIAFDGTNLWYSQPDASPSDIFQTSTSGVLLKTLTSINAAGALAWDGANLWVGVFNDTSCSSPTSGCSLIFQVNPSTGAVLKTLDISAIFAADGLGGCNIIDGLDFDSSTGTLWVSPDIGCSFAISSSPCLVGFVYNIDTSGNLLKRLQLPCGVAGVAKVGQFLYTVQEQPNGSGPRRIVKTTLDGQFISSFNTTSVSGNHESAEDLAFDRVTFAPSCALWAIQHYGSAPNIDASLAAYQVPCS